MAAQLLPNVTNHCLRRLALPGDACTPPHGDRLAAIWGAIWG